MTTAGGGVLRGLRGSWCCFAIHAGCRGHRSVFAQRRSALKTVCPFCVGITTQRKSENECGHTTSIAFPLFEGLSGTGRMGTPLVIVPQRQRPLLGGAVPGHPSRSSRRSRHTRRLPLLPRLAFPLGELSLARCGPRVHCVFPASPPGLRAPDVDGTSRTSVHRTKGWKWTWCFTAGEGRRLDFWATFYLFRVPFSISKSRIRSDGCQTGGAS